jgi:hypothetical protein
MPPVWFHHMLRVIERLTSDWRPLGGRVIDEIRRVGDGRSAITNSERTQERGHVDLRCRLGDIQGAGNLFVGSAAG